MCVAVPGKVISIEGTVATVDYKGNTVRAEAGLVNVHPGDYVLIHAGCILQVMTQQDYDALEELLEEIDECPHQNFFKSISGASPSADGGVRYPYR